MKVYNTKDFEWDEKTKTFSTHGRNLGFLSTPNLLELCNNSDIGIHITLESENTKILKNFQYTSTQGNRRIFHCGSIICTIEY